MMDSFEQTDILKNVIYSINVGKFDFVRLVHILYRSWLMITMTTGQNLHVAHVGQMKLAAN